MDLRAYFKKYLVHSKKFCKELGIPYQTFYTFYTGKSKISLEMAVKIEQFTKGEVTCKDLAKVNAEIDEQRNRLGENFRGLYVDDN